MPSGPELYIVLGIAVLLFGSKKLPDAARSIGRSMRILKAETKGLRDEDGDGRDDKTGQPMPAKSDERDSPIS